MAINIRRLFLFFLVPAFCAHANLPAWIQTPPTSDTELFAIGEGNNKEQAKDVALKNILGQLRTRLNARFEQKQLMVNDRFDETIKQTINSSIEELPISQYKELKNHQENGVFYNLISVTKKQLASTFTSEIKSKLHQAKQVINTRKTGGSELEWWFVNKDQLLATHTTNLRLLDILAQLDHPSNQLSTELSAFEKQLVTLQNSNCLYVKPHKKLADIQFSLREQIVALGLPADNENCRYSISTKDDAEVRLLFGKHTASVKLNLTLFNQQRSLASEQLFETGTSMSSAEFATKGAYQRLVNTIRSDNGAIISKLLTN
ncbi:LPP20 family lipoprotein [Alteromonadaceae bacterium BrNp21-10]|nr:LPP20 family lipoprotein [Alteromonadaceae bacterium BrNp21-10]